MPTMDWARIMPVMARSYSVVILPTWSTSSWHMRPSSGMVASTISASMKASLMPSTLTSTLLFMVRSV